MADAPFSFLPLGAIIQTFNVGGINIVQGFPKQEDYPKYNTPYFGETIGRVANRISGAQLNDVNGQAYPLLANNGPNTLHGGKVSWGKRIWNGPTPVGTREIPGVEGLKGGESVEFTLTSEDGDEGFPGTLEVKVVYTTGTQDNDGKEAIVLGMEYEAKLVDGTEETAIMMTNHSYFNLTGDETHEGTICTLPVDQYLPVNAHDIPTGGPAKFPVITANEPFTFGATEPDVDHCFLTNLDPASVPIDTRAEALALNLAAHHPKTGIHLEVLSTEPAFQFYMGRYIDVPEVEGAPARGARSGFCCEPGRWINAVNVPEWRNQMVLKKGETYGCRIVYRAWQE